MNALLSVAPIRSWELMDWFIAVIVLAAACAVVYYVLQWMGMTIPPIALKVVGIVLVAILGVAAIRFLFAA